MSYTSPTFFHVETPGSPTQLPVHGVQEAEDDRWSGMLFWSRGESDVCASVQATDGVRDPGLSMWPPYLRLEIVAAGIRTLDIQAWLLKHKASVARIQCAPDNMDNHEFGELVMSLRERKSVAIVRWEIPEEGSPKRGRLVLAPLHGALLCAVFLNTDIPELPMAPQAQQDEQRFLLGFQPALSDGLVAAAAS